MINNIDPLGEGRVQVKLPWLPGFEPWARVAAAAAGSRARLSVIPQIDDEVLVAFDHGDVSAPYVIGALWNGTDQPPRVLADRRGEQDDPPHAGQATRSSSTTSSGSVTITTTAKQKVTIGRDKIELEASSVQGHARGRPGTSRSRRRTS